jgi:hypothetical protein
VVIPVGDHPVTTVRETSRHYEAAKEQVASRWNGGSTR